MDLALPALLGLGGFLAVLFVLEHVCPLRRSRARLIHRLLVNITTSALAFGAAMTLVRHAAAQAFDWASEWRLGIVQLVETPPVVQFGAAFLLMDLFFYYWHRLNHRVPLLWRFHNVHHIDPDLDVSTAFRFHFGEVAASAAFRVVQILAIGPSLAVFVAYEVVFQANTLFHHSNLRLPIRLERLLNRIVVTPRMHGIHHSEILRENRSNYGVVFPWWDRIHRTVRLNVPQSAISIGVTGYSLPEDNRLPRVLAMPFRRQRDYWVAPDGVRPERNEATLEQPQGRLAE